MNSRHYLRNSLAALATFAAFAFTPLVAADPNAPINTADFKPPIRLACLGDSITFGVGAGAGQSWPDQLQRMLGDGWDVRNFGHSGASVAKGDKHSIWSQKEYANALLFHPDVAIILLGTNDTKPENWAGKAQFPKLYKDLVVSFAALSSKPRIFCGTPPHVAKKGNFGINEDGVLEQIPLILQVAKDWNAGVINIHAATMHDEWFKDSVHPSAEGAAAIAQAAYRSFTGKEWQGEVPAPSRNQSVKPKLRTVAVPGEITFRDLFTMIVSEINLTREAMQPLREKFDTMAPKVEAKLQEFEDRIAGYETLRMKYKHTNVESEKPLYGEYRSKVAEARQELTKFKLESNAELIAAIPQANKAEFGAAWLVRYVMDRLAPIAVTLTQEQRKRLHEVCAQHGAAYASITNTPERSIKETDVYRAAYATVLNSEQKRRVEPQ